MIAFAASTGITAWRRRIARTGRVPARLVADLPATLTTWRPADLIDASSVDELLTGALDRLAPEPAAERSPTALPGVSPIGRARHARLPTATLHAGGDRSTPTAAAPTAHGAPVDAAPTIPEAAFDRPVARSTIAALKRTGTEPASRRVQPSTAPGRQPPSRLFPAAPSATASVTGASPTRPEPRDAEAFTAALYAAPRNAALAHIGEPSRQETARTTHQSVASAADDPSAPATSHHLPEPLPDLPTASPDTSAPEPSATPVPNGLAGLASWWADERDPDHEHAAIAARPAARDACLLPAPAVPDAAIDTWPETAEPRNEQGPFDPLHTFRDALEQVLLDEALADGLDVR